MPKPYGMQCGGFLEVQLSQNPLEFKVRKETGVFNVEETLIVGGADGVSPWCSVLIHPCG